MKKEKYLDMNEMSMFGFIANALDSKKDDGDKGALVPRSDAEDLSKGVRFVPGEVTLARRAGEKVEFINECGPNCWYWKMPDGSRIYHWDPLTYGQIGRENDRKEVDGKYTHGVGPCPRCGNINTGGGVVK